MKVLLVLAALVVASQAFGKWKGGLSVRFDIGLFPGRNFFISIPQKLSEAKNARWVESPRPAGQPREGLVLYNPSRDDVVIGAFYDKQGDVAGLQIALPMDKFNGFPFDWKTQGYTEWTAPENSQGEARKYQTTAVYFVSDASRQSPEDSVARQERVLKEDKIYLTGFNGELLPVPTKASEIASNTDFKRQNCIVFMGRHYFYNMTKESPVCSADEFFPWFTLVDESNGADQLLGVGFISFGTLPPSDLKRDYFERPDESVTRNIANNGPECFYENVSKYGGVTMHIYFVDAPLLINCINT